MSMLKRNVFFRFGSSFLAILLVVAAPALAVTPSRVPKAADAPVYYSAYNGHPKLVVIVIIDQFRGDYLDRYRADFKGRGFRLFLDHGAYFPDCYYDYANTKTAPGHATLGTGAYTDGHGIAGNEWWDLDRSKDHPISSVEDERYRLIGAPSSSTSPAAAEGPNLTPTAPASTASGSTPTASTTAIPSASPAADSAGAGATGTNPSSTPAKTQPGASPRNLLASTVGDELRLATQGQSRVYGISLKDRAAILPSGSAANAAYWIDAASGYFITSTYYESQLPAWVTAFNTGGRIDQAYGEAKADAAAASVAASPAALTPAAALTSGVGGSATLNQATGSQATGNQVTGGATAQPEAGPYPTGKGFYGIVGSSPAANSYELDFAKALIQGEQLGQHPTTDLVTISLSANDIMGHQTGPDSPYEQQMVDGLDAQLDSFFTWLDKDVEGGMANVWVALCADHGIAPIPSQAAKLGMPATTVDLPKLSAAINDAINLKFSPGEKVDYLLSHQELPYLELNRPAFERAGVNETEAEEAVQTALPVAVSSLGAGAATTSSGDPAKIRSSNVRLPPDPILVRSYTRLQLASGEMPRSELGALLAHSYSPNGGWYVMTIFADYQMEAYSGSHTNHFSPWSYDRHVPLGFYGAPFTPGIYRGRVEPVDLAATLAALLEINQPSASVGHILTQALKPASAVTYPRPVVRPKARGRRVRGQTADVVSATPGPGIASSAPAQAPAVLDPQGKQPR